MSRRRDLCEGVFAAMTTREGLRYMEVRQIAVRARAGSAARELGRVVVARVSPHGGVQLVLALDRSLIFLEVHGVSAYVEAAAPDGETATSVLDRVTTHIEASEDLESVLSVTFWANGPRAPTSAHRRIEAQAWHEVAANYAASSAGGLGELARARASTGGRLILWHGEPGTGKTHALRALCREWRDWCSAHFITDPEAFLGESTAYLLEVLTSSDLERSRSRDWKLLILEDAGELLTADAKARTGQALSRLLNVTDGLIGQGMNALALVTTNEPLRRLHPAVQRAGRCWSIVEFEPLSVSEANDWLLRADSPLRVSRPTTLADLYALTRGENVPESESFGFGAG